MVGFWITERNSMYVGKPLKPFLFVSWNIILNISIRVRFHNITYIFVEFILFHFSFARRMVSEKAETGEGGVTDNIMSLQDFRYKTPESEILVEEFKG